MKTPPICWPSGVLAFALAVLPLAAQAQAAAPAPACKQLVASGNP